MKHDFEITEKLPVEFKTKWVEALRSGDYNQGQEDLYRRVDNSYCCLGVAGKICGIDVALMDSHGFLDTYFIKDLKEVPKLLIGDRTEEIVNFLTTMNDEASTFEEIADWIETNL